MRLGAPLTRIDLPSLHHAFDAFEDNALSRSAVAMTLDFLERELSPEGMRDLAAELGVQRGNSWYNAACCHALLGDKARALALLEQLAGVFQGDRSGWMRDPDLATLRDEARFQALLAR